MSENNAVAVITGGAGGIGLATARRFLANGARVAVLDRSTSALERARMELSQGDRLLTFACDVTDRTSIDAALAAIVNRWDSIDALVNGAGICTFGAFEELTEEAWDLIVDVNLKGTFLCCQAVVPHMRAKGSGAIVNVASQAGRRGEKLIAHYCAAKGAVVNLSRAMALELAPIIRVNVVCPGVIRTEMIEGELKWREQTLGEDIEQTLAQWRSDIPLGRFQRPDDIAEAIAFLASKQRAGEITGQALSVDGGTVMI
ncbi:MAG TPA: SDR family NAD(P)-dependent oxidoreductase [Solirubrobacteraceae bacterium]|jgi:NAD(P)-dependent dehydrogenase (short-subunit alcohol dehydrogenase family)|nr:SDR family NAD(P)-dependent oxidoreductase [Solirubrobacteraceae bacterium]